MIYFLNLVNIKYKNIRINEFIKNEALFKIAKQKDRIIKSKILLL